MQDGVKKTSLELDLFGGSRRSRFAAVPEHPFPDIADKARALDANLDGGALQAVTHLQQNVRLLGQTFEVDFIFPIVQKVVPAIDAIVTGIGNVIVAFHNVDEATHGFLSWAVVIGGIVVGIGAMAFALGKVVTAVRAVIAVLNIQAGIQAFITALQGPRGIAIVAAAGVVAAGVGYAAYNASNAGGTPAGTTTDAANRFSGAVDRFGAAVNTLQSWSQVAGDQVPQGFTPQAFAWLKEQEINGAVG